jgi:hypothetical protein
VPHITTSRGTTRIALEGALVWDDRLKQPPKIDHSISFGAVYANHLAAPAMSAPAPGKFPVGSVIVREKLPSADAARPDLLAVMVKREPGFNKTGGDWEFLVFDGELTRVQTRQKKGNCLECHASRKESDFIFPLSLPKAGQGLPEGGQPSPSRP